MTQYTVSWVDSSDIRPEDLNKACRQVYVWIITKDKHVVVVSKDGMQWQLPGGKPELGESLRETAVREVREETNLDISTLSDKLRFFGYQIVNDIDAKDPPYLQIRYLLPLAIEANSIELGIQSEDQRQIEKDIIQFVDTITIHELPQKIPWMLDSPELKAVTSLISL